MNNRSKLIALLAMLLALGWAAGASAEFMAGAAVADITPDVTEMRVPSSGYGARGKTPMKGVRDHVHCKALVVSGGDERAALVTCDLIGISRTLREKVVAGLAGSGIDDKNLMMTASHTHSGPGAMQKNFIAGLVFGRYNEELTQTTADKIVAAVKRANSNMQPATLLVARTKVEGATRNRRDPAGSYNYDTRRFTNAYDPDNPENVIDTELTLLRIDDQSGKPMAVVISFATHATVLGSDNMMISADWPGLTQRKVEEAVPGAVALFVNGAIGDQAPAMEVDQISDDEYLEIIGGKVADGALSVLDSAEQVSALPLRSIMDRREIPPGNRVMGIRVPRSLIKHYFPEMPLQAIRMGDVTLMGAPVEMVSDIGHIMKEGADGQGVEYPVVAGLANGVFLYCVTPDDFEQGGYEAGNTIYGKIEAGVLIGEQMMLVRKALGR